NNQYVFGNGCDTSTNRDLCFYWRASTNVGAFPHMKDSSTTITTSFNADLNDGNWHMMTGVVDHVNKEVRGYHNGVLYDTVSFTSLSFNPTANWILGNYNNGGTGNDYDGYLDEFTIYENYVLTSNDIDDLYNLGWHKLNNESTTTGVIDTGVQDPNLSFTDSNLPDNTDDFSVGSWVKLDMSRDSTLDGTANGDPTSTTGKVGNAISFDGVDDKFTLGTIGDWNFLHDGSDFSISWWQKLNSLPSEQQGILGTGTGGSSIGFDLKAQLNNNGRLVASIENGQGATASITSSNNFIPQDTTTWYHYVLTHSNGAWNIYRDGGNNESASSSVSWSTSNHSRDMELANANANTPTDVKDLTADLDEMVIYDRVITSSEISALYNSGSGTSTPNTNGMVAHYDFEQTGTTLESQVPVPPTNFKLLNLNDVTFNVGTTSASVSGIQTTASTLETTASHQVTDASGTQSLTGTTYQISANEIRSGSALIGKTVGKIDLSIYNIGSPTGEAIAGVFDSNGNILYEFGRVDVSTLSNTANNPSANWVTFDDATTSYTLSQGEYFGLYYDGGDSSNKPVSGNDDSSPPFANDYWHRYDGSNWQNYGSLIDLTFRLYEGSPAGSTPFNIISATGLSDNTSTPQHYVFTRSGNNWTIYQNSVSEATATDTTSLGANSVASTLTQEFTSNLGGTSANGISSSQAKGSQLQSGHALIGTTIGQLDFNLACSGTCSGTLEAGVWTSASQTPDVSFGTLDFSTVPSTLTTYSFNSNSHTLAVGDVIGVSCIGCSGTPQFQMSISSDNDPNEVFAESNPSTSHTTWLTNSAHDVDYTAYSGSPASTSYYTTHIDGMIDEYFINSDSLTSTEVDMAYEKGSEPTQIDTTGASVTEYDDSNVTGGTEYYYTVKATNAVGDSDFLTPFVSALAGTPPDVPTSVSSTINSPNTAPLDITVSWSAPTNVGTGTLTGFEIYRDSVLIDTTGLVTSYTDTVPSGGGTFEYKLKAVSTHGTSGFSSTTSTTTPSVPPAPTNAPVLAINNPNPSPLDIDVSWTEPASGGSIIQSYEVFRSATETGTYTSVGTVTDLDFTDTVPSAGTWYYKFTAINLVGSSGLSPSNSITTASVPSSPLNASSVIPSINSAPYDVTVSWDLPT
ncbi:MAG: hypothetical protein JSU89_03090, partial [Myxococcales bacterium]